MMIFWAMNKRKFVPSWIWILIIGLPIYFLARWFFWWLLSPSYPRTAAVEIKSPDLDPQQNPVKNDDLRLIKGIGPKTSAALYQAGILTFKQLGLMDPGQLELILARDALPSSKVSYWQQQAVLATAGDWKGLEKLQK